MRRPKLPEHEGCFIFECDFDTRKVMAEPIGRLVLSNGSVVRLVFTLEGLKMIVSQSAIDAKSLIITPIPEEIIFAGVPK